MQHCVHRHLNKPGEEIAYVLNNHYADVYGVELGSCKQVFHASITHKPGE